MNESLDLSVLVRSVWHDFLRVRRVLVIYECVFKLTEAWLLAPALAVLLAAILTSAGHVAVSNVDIVTFLLTPLGLLYAGLFAVAAVAVLLFEQGGVMVLAAWNTFPGRPSLKEALRAIFASSFRIVQLSAAETALLALALLPFVLVAALTYGQLLSEYDTYFYLKERPPVFWLAASVGGVLLMAALAVGAWLYVRWAIALPILLFEKQGWRAALRASRERVRGVAWCVGFILVGWLVGVGLLAMVAEAGFRLFAAAVLDHAGPWPITLIVLLLLAQGMLVASVSFVLVTGFGLITRRLYILRSQPMGERAPDRRETLAGTPRPVSRWNRRLAWLCLPLFLLAPLSLWIGLSRYLVERPPVKVTAHRGHARAAPENTLSAMRKAIESGADYAEMDVQQTADGKVVLVHDRDFKRVAGVSRRVDELTYTEVRQLDVGSWFDPAYAGERVPTLAEVVRLCRGKIRLNIELKFFGSDRRLARAVADIVREQGLESDCLITSLDYDALVEVRQQDARLRTGIIVAHALGDVSRLKVDALSVRADFLSDELLRSAHRRGLEVHVWTVNDARQMARLIKRGVDNIITSDPDLAIRTRDEWADLTRTERLVLASRLLLGLNP